VSEYAYTYAHANTESECSVDRRGSTCVFVRVCLSVCVFAHTFVLV